MFAPTPTVSAYAGDNISLAVQVLNNQGAPYPLTAVTGITYQIANGYNQPILTSKSLGNGISITNSGSGQYLVSLAKADTLAFNGNYVHSSQIMDNTGATNTVFSGIIVFVPMP